MSVGIVNWRAEDLFPPASKEFVHQGEKQSQEELQGHLKGEGANLSDERC